MLMDVDVDGTWWMELDHQFLRLPKKIPNKAHLFPSRGPGFSGDTYMLPPLSLTTRDYVKVYAFPAKLKVPVVTSDWRPAE